MKTESIGNNENQSIHPINLGEKQTSRSAGKENGIGRRRWTIKKGRRGKNEAVRRISTTEIKTR